ncbi:hypothetical protein [Halomicrobium salinisoli]|uniref:hypothetical protein n=1 Tax=Halomicrobium salinisoli TaxID=2878391 RepID=UPI001CF05C2F|nr:hypothetical protein [Halomicrobium salinisoli]
MPPSRRDALLSVGGLGTTLLSGCNGIFGRKSRLSLTLLNFDDERHYLGLELLEADASEYDEAVALNEEFELPPDDGESVGSVEKPDLLESRKYLVRASLADVESVRDTYHFYPDCRGDGDQDELYVEIHRPDDGDDEPYVGFQQNRC